MKKMCVVYLLFLILICMSGCRWLFTYSYSIDQSPDQVEKIEICKYDYKTEKLTSIKTLDEQEKETILTEIPLLTCRRHFPGNHRTDYGEIVIFITYKDNTAEVLGVWNVAKVDGDGDWNIGMEYFEEEDFLKMLLKYLETGD